MAKTIRTSRRFNPDAGKYALLDFNDPKKDFEPLLPALIVNEANSGLKLVMLAAAEIEIGDSLRVQLGDEDPRECSVRWKKEIDADVVSIGVEYEE